MSRAVAFALVLAGAAAVARAEPAVLRMATIAPEGSAWANLLRASGREAEDITDGQVKMKWYFGAVTGDELKTLEGIRKGHLDGIASGGVVCERLAPSMRVQGLTGVFQSRGEAEYVMERLHATIEEETQRSGFEMLVVTGLGPEVLFSRTPVRTMEDFKRIKLWRWSADEIGIAVSEEMGLKIVGTDVDQASRAYDQHQVDGFLGIPTAALAFQWSTQAKYITDLRVGYLQGCVAITNRALDKLAPEHHRKLRALFAKYDALFQEVGRMQDDALLGGLFQKQGLKPIPPSEALRSEFFEAARGARERTVAKWIPRPLLDRVLNLLADYRAEHR
jgi:TRAP-type C4-dicarboxylate transport system substrate-binding protein